MLVVVKINDGACQRALIGFYGLPYSTKRRKAWKNLEAMLLVIEEPWVCLGDFNQEKIEVGELELQCQILFSHRNRCLTLGPTVVFHMD